MTARRIARFVLASCPAFLAVAIVASAQSDPAKDPKPAPAPSASTPAPAPVEEKFVYVKMATSKGDIVLELNETKAPISVANFLSYVNKGHYSGTIFHRVMPTFMIQGGGFTEDLTQKPVDPPIRNEWQNGLKNVRGSIAMARTNVADSATSQFFINVVDNGALDQPRDGAAYAVFGKVVEGMDVVDAIKAVPTGVRGPHKDCPIQTVAISKVERLPDYKKK